MGVRYYRAPWRTRTQLACSDWRRVVGAAHVLTTAADVAPYTVDWRGRYHGAALRSRAPASTAEVAAVVTLCADARVADRSAGRQHRHVRRRDA